MSKWGKVRIGEVCSVVSGTTPKSNVQAYWDGKYNWVTPAELTDDTVYVKETQRKITQLGIEASSLKSFPIGTVLLSSRAPIGKVAIACTEMYCNQGFKNLICSGRIHNKYLYWFLKDHTSYLNSLGRGATFKELSKKIVEQIEIPLPPLEIQRQISIMLDAVSALLKLRKQKLAELDKLIQSVFYDMFGDPVTNEKRWKKKKFSDCCQINPRKSEIKYFSDTLKVSFVSMPRVSENGLIDVGDTRTYGEVKTGFTYFYDGDVLFAKITPCMENGKGAIAKGLINKIGFGSTEFHVFRPIAGVSNSEWIYYVSVLPIFRVNARKSMTGSAGQRRVPLTFFDRFLIPLPPIQIQNHFKLIVQKIERQKLLVQESIDETQKLFNSLMSEYFD